MYSSSTLPIFICLSIAILSCLFLAKYFEDNQGYNRFVAIDGLRGYLAFGVFLHHSIIWYFYLKTGNWAVPSSNLYTHLGQTSVVLFFMITGFLFYSKVLAGKSKPIDWLRLYVSRVLRLTPLYAAAMVVLVTIVAILSKGQFRESVFPVMVQTSQWLGFTIMGAPDINKVHDTRILIASVTWSLVYEWFFYGVLPLLALANRVRVGWAYLILSIATVALMLMIGTSKVFWLAFVCGIVAARLIRIESLCEALRKPIASVVAIGLIGIVIGLFPTGYGPLQIALVAGSFLIIAAGNGVFGILTHRISRVLGDMAYGIYLLHGLILFITFRFVIGFDVAKTFDPIAHWAVVVAIVPVLISIAALAFKQIELPALSKTDSVTRWLRSKAR